MQKRSKKKYEPYKYRNTFRDFGKLKVPNYDNYFDRFSPNYADNYNSPFRRYF